MKASREVHADGWRVRLDLARQLLRLEVPESEVDWDRRERRPRGIPLLPTLTLPEDGPVSAAALLLKAKSFDDRLYAAIELAAQRGAGTFAGKATLLRSLAETLARGLPSSGIGAATTIHVACELGGIPVVVPETAAETVRSAKSHFLRDELLSKPLGFYTWAPELSAIFRQDRFLQQALEPDVADDLARAVELTPGVSEAYAAYLRLNAGLTNPPRKLGLKDAAKRPPYFPPSRSHEVILFEKMYEDRLIPEGFDLMGELIRQVRSGAIDLEPSDSSGWYDRQTWSLEPLLLPDRMPERARLELGKRYRKHLEDLFRGALALTRETHVKQAGGGRGGYGGPRVRPIWVRPELSVEPLPTLYTRRAAGYRYVRSVLEEAFGTDGLSSLNRFTPDGTLRGGLAEELVWIETLFSGASATASVELGMGLPDAGDANAECFSVWRANLRFDEDVSRDARVMVPVFYDIERKKTKVWVLLGWRTVAVDTEYRVPPSVVAVEPLAGGEPASSPPPVLFTGDRYELTEPVMAEVYVSQLLNRDEFRRHCDRFVTREAILANLG
jgi:hypothetical protein